VARAAEVGAGCDDGAMPDRPGHPGSPRFLTLADVAEVLNTSSAQVYALVRRGELPAIKIGGRGQWRVEASRLEDYIAQQYRHTEQYVAEHPFVESEVD
jgi:excisionase family DNA binding protein